MANTLGKVVGYASLVLWNALCLFSAYIMLCGILNFWHTAQENSHNSAISARRPRLVVAGATASLAFLVSFVWPLYDLRVLLWVEAISIEVFHTGNRVCFLVVCWTLMSGFVWFGLRFWLAFFDIRWSAQQKDTKLLQYLDPLYQFKQQSPALQSVASVEDLDSDADGSGENDAANGWCHYLQCCGFCRNSQTGSSFADETLKQTYGNEQWLIKRAAVFNVIMIVFTLVLAFINYSLIVAFFGFSALSVAVFLFTLERLTPEFNDCIAIREEQRAFRRVVSVGAIGALFWALATVIDTQAMGGPKKDPGSIPRPLIVVAYVVCMYTMLISAAGSGLVLTLYAIYCTDLVKRVDRHYTLAWLRPAVAKYRQLMALLCHGFRHTMPIGFGGHISMSSLSGLGVSAKKHSTQLSNSAQKPPKMKIRDVIADSDGLRAFTTHLFKEFSIENILCLIEVIRFRNMWNPESPVLAKARSLDSGLLDRVGSDKQQTLKPKEASKQTSAADLDSINEFESPPTAPRIKHRRVKSLTNVEQFEVRFPAEVESTTSAIVNKDTPIETQFALLCHKYIRNDTQFSVNLPYRMRAKLLRKRDALEDTENMLPFAAMFEDTPHTAFDRVILELFNLLADSLWRFERTKDFKRLQERHNARFRESQTPLLRERMSGSIQRSVASLSALGGRTPSVDLEEIVQGF